MTTLDILAMPEVQISSLTQLQWAVENWQINLGECAVNTDEAYRQFDEAIENGMTTEERQMFLALLDICEEAQKWAYKQLDIAKQNLLATWG